MSAFDRAIRQVGIACTIYQIISPVYEDGEFNWVLSTKKKVKTYASLAAEESGTILSKSSTLQKKPEGWADNRSFRAFFQSTIKVPSKVGIESDVVVFYEGTDNELRYRIEAYDQPRFGRITRNSVLLQALIGQNQG